MRRDGQVIALTPLEFDLLVALARKPWQVFTREVLLEQVWGYRHAADTRLVNVHVQRLRSKVERDPERPEIVVTVRGVGLQGGAGLTVPRQLAETVRLPARLVVPAPLRRPVRLAVGRWRRSMQLRVVATTVVLGIVVVLVVGQLLLQRITSGIIASRQEVVTTQSRQDFVQTRKDLTSGAGEQKNAPTIGDALSVLAGPKDNPTRYMIFEKALGNDATSGPNDQATGGISTDAIPPELRRAVVASGGGSLPSQVFTTALSGRQVPVIAVGGLLDLGAAAGGRYELYFVYKLDREVLDVVRRTFILGGIALVLLVGAVAWVVTRQVVAPVAQAARTAEELASGRLDRRMQVRGDDELARLGRAFNEMAASLERQIHQLEELSHVQRRFVSDVSHELRTPLTTLRHGG